jgi:uncharacterized membrane protein
MGDAPPRRLSSLLSVIGLVLVLLLFIPATGRAAPLPPSSHTTAALLNNSCESGACLAMVGPRLAGVDSQRGLLLNALFSALLGNQVNLTVLDWNAIATAHLDVIQLLDVLQSDLQLASPQQVLDTDITLLQFLNAAADVAHADGNTAAVSALNALSLGIAPLTGTIRLGDLIQSDFPDGALAVLEMDLLSLLTGVISLFNYENVLTTPQPISVSGSALGLPNVAETQLYAQVIEPPIVKCGPTGTQFYSAEIRIKLNVNTVTAPIRVSVLGLGQVSVSLTQLGLYLDVARAQGTLNFVDTLAPQVGMNVQPGIVHAYIGTISDNLFFNRDTVITPAMVSFSTIGEVKVGGLTAALRGKADALGSTTNTNLTFNGPFPQTQTVGTSATFISNLVSTLVNDLELQVTPNILGVLLNTVLNLVRPLLNTLITPILSNVLGGLVDPLLVLLGIGIGEADVTVLGVGSAQEYGACLPTPTATATPSPTFTPSPTATNDPTATPTPMTQTVSGKVWEDSNQDGQRDDATEPRIEGIIVRLYNVANREIAVTTTNSNGEYLFTGLVAGTYSIEVDESNFGNGFPLYEHVLTVQNASGVADTMDSDFPVDSPHRVTISVIEGIDMLDVDAGAYPNGVCSVGLDVYYLLDLSGSMDFGYSDGITKLDAAKQAIQQTNSVMAQWNNGSRIGLLGFYGTAGGGKVSAFVDQIMPMTEDYVSFDTLLGQLNASGTTPTAHGIEVAYQRLAEETNAVNVPVILLITDGVPTVNADNPFGPPNPFDYDGYSGYLFNDMDVQAVSIRDGFGGYRSINDVRNDGTLYQFSPAPYTYIHAGDPVADVMENAEAAMLYGPAGLTIHGIAIQGEYGGDIFNDAVVEYVAETGNGVFVNPDTLSELTAALQAAVQESACQ